MNRTAYVNIVAAALAVATLAFAAIDTSPRATLMTTRDYENASRQISRDAHAASVVCKRLTGAELAVCRAEVDAEELVARADLEARYTGTYDAERLARYVRAEAQHSVDQVRCDAIDEGASRDRCLLGSFERRASVLGAIEPAVT